MKWDATVVMDEINRKAWHTEDAIEWFGSLEGFTDRGEEAALASVRSEVLGEPILDLGVGGGRTVPILRRLSQDYTGIDYTPELVARCRKKYPGVRILDGDARDLSCFAAESFKLVVFSFNGIDAVNPEDRQAIHAEVMRVLVKGGIFLFSAHNQHGPGHGEALTFGVDSTRNPVKLMLRALRAARHAPRTVQNYLRYSSLNGEHDGYSIMNASAHHHGLLIHYITLERQCEELAEAGFRPDPAIFASTTGRSVRRGDETRDAWWLHYVARKPGAAM